MNFNELKMPPPITTAVAKPTLEGFSSRSAEPSKWEEAKNNLANLLDDLRCDLNQLRKQNSDLQQEVLDLKALLEIKNNASRTYEMAWVEAFGDGVFDLNRKHIKMRTGL